MHVGPGGLVWSDASSSRSESKTPSPCPSPSSYRDSDSIKRSPGTTRRHLRHHLSERSAHAKKVLQSAKFITGLRHRIVDIVVHQPTSRTIVTEVTDNKVRVDYMDADSGKQSQRKLKYMEKCAISDKKELIVLKSIGKHIMTHAELLKAKPQEEIYYIEISIDDDMNTTMVIVKDNEKLSFRRVSLDTPTLPEVHQDMLNIQSTMVDILETTMEERVNRLNALTIQCCKMSNIAESYSYQTESIKDQEHVKASCGWLVCLFPCLKTHPWLACIGCRRHRKRWLADCKDQCPEQNSNV